MGEKMLVIVTGKIGVGKSTVCRELIRIIRRQGYLCGGVLTLKSVDSSIIVEDIRTGEKDTLASEDRVYQGPQTKRYGFNPEGIAFGLRAIEEAAFADVLIIDEIGHLELRGEGFAASLKMITNGNFRNCVLVIRQELLDSFSPHLPRPSLVFEITLANRDTVPKEIGAAFLQKLRDAKNRL
ncbi:nucleoside-triphosphatase [Chloroflexota bacterium]